MPSVTIYNVNKVMKMKEKPSKLSDSVQRFPKMHLFPLIILFWCYFPSHHAHQSALFPLQAHYSISWRTALIPACLFLKMAFLFFMARRSCQSVLWLQTRAPFPGEVPSLNLYWKFKCLRTTCDTGLCTQVYSCIREPDSSERPALLGGPSGRNNRI